jgi:hypothetical protein
MTVIDEFVSRHRREPLLNSLPNCTETGNFGDEIPIAEAPLTDSALKGYIQFSSLSAGVAKLAYAADSKSAGT